MYIQSFLRPNTDILVVMDYPSVNDIKGLSLQDSNAVSFLRDQFRRHNVEGVVSYHQLFDEALRGIDLVETYVATTKADKKTAIERHGVYLRPEIEGSMLLLDEVVEKTQPKVILCMSVLALAWWFGGVSLDAWRGSMLHNGKCNVVVSLDIYALYKRDEMYMAWTADLQRVNVGLEQSFENDLDSFNIEICPTIYQVREFFETWLSEADLPYCNKLKLAFDVETRAGTVSVIGFATSPRDAFVIPLINVAGTSYWSAEEEFEIIKYCQALLCHPKVVIATQNGQYDLQYMLKVYGVSFKIGVDTMIEAHMLFTKGQKLSLSYLASLFCSYYRYWKEDGKDFHKSFQTESDFIKYQRYNGYDTCYTFELAETLVKINQKDTHPFVRDMQRQMQNIVIKPVVRGLRFDMKKQQEWKEQHLRLKRSYESWFNYIMPDNEVTKQGAAAWWDSPSKMAHLFYNQLGLTPVLDKKTKRPTTSDAALVELGKQEPIVKILMDVLRDYRSLSKTLDTYLAAKPSPEDGRMRTQYMLAGTDTFRLASKIDAFGFGLNLQNLTKG